MSTRQTNDDNIDTINDTFSQTARQVHTQALDHVSARVQAQLAQRRRVAMNPPQPTSARRWPALALGGGGGAALALAIALRLQFAAPAPDATLDDSVVAVEPTAHTATSDAVAVTETATADAIGSRVTSVASATNDTDASPVLAMADGDDLLLETFEENPDFYLWLASEDAADFAVESL